MSTVTSAVTVTGLVVVDTGTIWSGFGELVILVLIQIGGLRIMTLAGFVGITINRRFRVGSAARAAAEIGLGDLGVLRNLIRDLVRLVFVAEATVAVLLTFASQPKATSDSSGLSISGSSTLYRRSTMPVSRSSRTVSSVMPVTGTSRW